MSGLPQASKVDRQTTTPFLLKLFYKQNSWHRPDEFSANGPLPPHLQIYTWPSCSLRELSHLMTSALPSLLPSPAAGTRLAYRLVYPDAKSTSIDPSRPGRFLSKELGSVVVGSDSQTDTSTGGSAGATLDGDSEKTLQDARFIIGDYVSCVVLPPLGDGSVAPAPVAPGPSSRGAYGGGPPRGGYPPSGEGGYSFRGRGPRTADFGRGPNVPHGEWRRGERLPDRGGGFGGGGFRGGRGRGRGW